MVPAANEHKSANEPKETPRHEEPSSGDRSSGSTANRKRKNLHD